MEVPREFECGMGCIRRSIECIRRSIEFGIGTMQKGMAVWWEEMYKVHSFFLIRIYSIRISRLKNTKKFILRIY